MTPPATSIVAFQAKEAITYRQSPCNIEAEQAVLGAILVNHDALNKVADFLQAEHFFEPVHQRIYAAMLRFFERGLVPSPVTLKAEFDKDEALKDLGGAGYLARIAGLASTILNVREYASIVYSLATSRTLIEIGEEMVNDGYSATGELRASEQIEKSEHKLFLLASEGSADANFRPLSRALADALSSVEKAVKRDGSISGIPTGFIDMDNLLGGMHNSDLIILAARPSMGKTALALNMALNAADQLQKEHVRAVAQGGDSVPEKPGSVGFISLEMSSEQLAVRLLSMKTGVNAGNIRRGKLERSQHNDEFAKLVRANQELYNLPLHVDDVPAQSISAIRTRARRMKRKHNMALLVIDYLQLIRGSSTKAQESRVQEISEITMGLKAIAKELNIPVLALSQLSRQVENREDKRPQLSDLRESGSIEQDADMVMFIYREAYYIERKKPAETDSEKMAKWQEEMGRVNNISEIIVAKNRNGPIDNVTLFFDKTTTRFGDLAQAGLVDGYI